MARSNQATTTPRATSERLYSQATEQLRRQARATRDLAERYHEQYRRSLESWVALRSRLQNRNGNGHHQPTTTRSASSRRTSGERFAGGVVREDRCKIMALVWARARRRARLRALRVLSVFIGHGQAHLNQEIG